MFVSVGYWGLWLKRVRKFGTWPPSNVEIKNVPSSPWCLLTCMTTGTCTHMPRLELWFPVINWCPKHMSWSFDIISAVQVKSNCSARYPVIEQIIYPATFFKMSIVRGLCLYLEAISISELCVRDTFNRRYCILHRKRLVSPTCTSRDWNTVI
jgi:hypothetical protein